VIGDQRVQPGDSLNSFGKSSTCEHLALVVEQLDVVMVLGPVISHEQHRVSFLLRFVQAFSSAEETAGDLMVKCSPSLVGGTSSQQRFRLLTTSGRTVCRRTSKGQSGKC
jgi:hypothetical protein